MSPTERAKSLLYYNALSACIQGQRLVDGRDNNLIDPANATAGRWFVNPKVGATNPTIGYFLTGSGVTSPIPGEKIGCGGDNVTWVVDAANLWGYASPIHLLCDAGVIRSNDSDCIDGSGAFKGTAGVVLIRDKMKLETFQSNIKSKVYGGQNPQQDDAARYILARNSFYAGCLANINPSPYTGSANDDFVYTVPVVDPLTGTVDSIKFYGTRKSSDSIGYSINSSYGNVTATCGELVDQMNSHSNAYRSYVVTQEGGDPDGGTVSTCTADECEESTATSSCVVEGVGWIVCPVTNFMATISDGAFSVIEEFLQVNVGLYQVNAANGGGESGTYTAWSAFRNIANVLFVIAFLVIIFSQLTGQGISNYGVKKTLPRLVVTVILVNVSFFVCQLAVDLTQIIGSSLSNFLQSIPVGGSASGVVETDWTDKMGDILAGTGIVLAATGAIAAGGATLALSVSAPVLLAVLLAVLMTVIILITRQAAIVILIVLAPIAFVAYLLPNTESWFKKWYKMFVALLMVYPIIAVLYGGGALASKIISNVAASAPDGEAFWLGLIALAVSALPLILTPFLLKGALDGTGTLGAKLSGMANKMNGRVGSAAKTQSRLGEAQHGLKNRFALNRARRRVESGYQQSLDQSKIGRALGFDKGTARAIKAVGQEEDSEVEARVAQIQFETNSVDRVPKATAMLKAAIESGDATGARAAQKVLLGSGNFGVNELQKTYEDKTVAQAMARADRTELTGLLRSDINSAGLKGKNNALARWGFDGTNPASLAGPTPHDDPSKKSREAFASDAETYAKLNSVELAGQSIGNLERARQHISRDDAVAVLSNTGAAAQLDPQKRKFFTEIAGMEPTTPNQEAAARALGTRPETEAANPDEAFNIRSQPAETSTTPPPSEPPAQPPQTPPTPPQGQ